MKKSIVLLFLCCFFIQIFSETTFNFERKFFVANGNYEITSISASENDIYLFMKKDSEDYIELHKDTKNPELFVFSLKDAGIYRFKYLKGEEEKEINQEIKVYESFDKFIKLTNKKSSSCFYLKDSLNYEIESSDELIQTSNLNNINIYLYQPENEITNSNEFLLKFSQSSNQYNLNLQNENISPGKYYILITEGDFIGYYLDKSNEIFITDIIPNSYFYVNTKKLYLNTLCEIKNPELKLTNNGIEKTINCDSNSFYEEKKKRYLCSFSTEINNGEYQINYNSNKLNGNIKGLNNINQFEFILNQPTENEKKLKYNDLSLSSDFENKNVDKLIVLKNNIERIEYLSSLPVDNPKKLLYDESENKLKFKIFVTKSDEFIFSKVIRKLEDFEKNNPPSENELSYTFNDVKFTGPKFDDFIFEPDYAFLFQELSYDYYNNYNNYYNDKTNYLNKYDIYRSFTLILNEDNKKDVNFYQDYFCSNSNKNYYDSRKFFFCPELKNDDNMNEGKNNEPNYNNDPDNNQPVNTNIIYGEYVDKTPGIAIFEHEEFSEKVSFNPIITYFTNLCQSLFEESSQPQNIILTFDVPLNRKVRVKYLDNFIAETKSEIKNNYISQTFTITNPIEDEIIKVFPTDDDEDYKEFIIEFSKIILNLKKMRSLFLNMTVCLI